MRKVFAFLLGIVIFFTILPNENSRSVDEMPACSSGLHEVKKTQYFFVFKKEITIFVLQYKRRIEMDKKEIAKQKAAAYFTRIHEAYNQLRRDVIDILEDMDGFVKTLPSTDNPIITATMEDYSGHQYQEKIYGIRLIDGDIFICTSTSLANYEYDNGYFFDYTYDFEDGTTDKENIEKLVNDPAYYIDIDEDYIDTRETLYSILSDIGAYLED